MERVSEQFYFDTDGTDSSVGDAYMRSLPGIKFPAPSETEHRGNIRVICVFRFAEPVPENLKTSRFVLVTYSNMIEIFLCRIGR